MFGLKTTKEPVERPVERSNAKRLDELEASVYELSEKITKIYGMIARINGAKHEKKIENAPDSKPIQKETDKYILYADGRLVEK
jgi:hypothetical protein